MKIREYLKNTIKPNTQPDLKLIYEDLMQMGYSADEINFEINRTIMNNIFQTVIDYQKKEIK